MINGFTAETRPLTEEERRLIPTFVHGMRCHIGAEAAISAAAIQARLKERGIEVTGSRIRKIIHHIRTKRLVRNLVANNAGYYIEEDPAKIRAYIESLEQRINTIREVANSFTP